MTAQIIATIIFLVMFILVVTEKIEKHYVTLGCGLLTLILVFGVCMQSPTAIMETLNFKTILTPEFWIATSETSESSTGINWATIIFITGMNVLMPYVVILIFTLI